MEKSNLDLSVVIYTILFDEICSVGKLNDAWELFSSLHAKGLQISVYTYTIMIKGFYKQGVLDKAEDLLMNIEENGCLPNNCIYI